MIYTDGVHLVSDTSLEELHDFAQKKLRFKASWFQNKQEGTPMWHPHYDLTTPAARQRALDAGATLVKGREIVQALRRLREVYPEKCQASNLPSTPRP